MNKWKTAVVYGLLGVVVGLGLDRAYLHWQRSQQTQARSTSSKQRLEEARKKREQKEEKQKKMEELKRWDPLPIKQQPNFGVAVSVPRLSAMTIGAVPGLVNGTVPKDSDLHNKLMDRLRLVLKQNPDPDMSRIIHGADKGDFDILFGYLPPSTMAVFRPMPIGDGKFQPEIVINLGILAEVQEADGLRYFQVVLYHEYWHYVQWLGVTTDKDRKTWVEQDPRKFDADDCRYRWNREYEAYDAASKKGVAWGVREDLTVRILDEPAFRQHVFFVQAQNFLPMMPQCAVVWAEQAGHPHPDAFEDLAKQRPTLGF